MAKKLYISMSLMIKVLLSLLIFTLQAEAQIKLSGSVKDKKTNEVLAYSTISLKKSKLGVVADYNGNFNLKLGKGIKKDTIQISHIGYKTIEMAVSESIKDTVFRLQESSIKLDEVKLYNNYRGKVSLGTQNAHHIIGYSFTHDSIKGSEIGKRILVEDPVLLKDLTFYVKKNTFKSVKIRVNFYYLDSSNNQYSPSDKIDLEKSIIEEITKKSGKIKLDLSDFNITINEDFMVAIEMIDFKGQGRFILKGEWHSPKARYKGIPGFSELPKDHTFVTGYIQSGFFKRTHNQDNWVEIRPHNLAVKISARKANE